MITSEALQDSLPIPEINIDNGVFIAHIGGFGQVESAAQAQSYDFTHIPALHARDISIQAASLPSVANAEVQDRNKYEVFADQIIQAWQQGKKIILSAHSMGATELVEVFKILEKRVSHFFFERNMQNIDIVLFSPLGMSEGNGALELARIAAELVPTQLEPLARPIGHALVEPTGMVPPIDSSKSDNHQAGQIAGLVLQAQQEIFGSAFNITENLPGLVQMTFNLDPHFYDQLISEQDRSLISLLDTQLMIILENSDESEMSQQLKQEIVTIYREKLSILRKYAGQMYTAKDYTAHQDNPISDGVTQPSNELSLIDLIRHQVGKMVHFAHTVNNAVRKDTITWMQDLHAKGAQLHFILPEHDIVMKTQDYRVFMNGLSNDHNQPFLYLVPGLQHNSAILQPTILQQVVKRIIERAAASDQHHDSP